MHLELIRLQYLPDRTLGTLHFVGDNQWHCDTLELPAIRANSRSIDLSKSFCFIMKIV